MLREHTYICVDIEAALIRGRQCMIEIGAVKWYPDGTMDTFTQLIQPYKFKKLNTHIQKLTGITTEQLIGAPSFKEAMHKFKNWCGNGCIFLTFGEFDRKVLEEELARNFMSSDFIFPMIDFQQKYMIANKLREQPSLGGLMNQLGLEVEVQHRALADANSLRQIFEKVDGEQLIQAQKTNKGRYLSTSLKPGDTHYELMVVYVDFCVTKNGIIIEKTEILAEKLSIAVREEVRTNEQGQEELIQSTKVFPSDKAKKLLSYLTQTIEDKILLTRTGLRPITKVLRLHNCTMQKTEVINLQHLLQEELVAQFSYQEETKSHFENKLSSLLNQYGYLLVDEYTKRDLFPNQVTTV